MPELLNKLFLIKTHEGLKQLILLNESWDLLQRVLFLEGEASESREGEFLLESEAVSEPIRLVRIGADLFGIVVVDKEEAGVDVFLSKGWATS